MEWWDLEHIKPDFCIPILGFSPEWIDEDYNPDGVRECFRGDDETWTSAKWNNYQDCYETDTETAPTHWVERPQPYHLLVKLKNNGTI